LKNKELFLIDKIRQRADKPPGRVRQGLRLGIGDDAAILGALPATQELLITTDLLVESAHFERRWHPPGALGHKVLARGLSDIAAMGGRPRWALLSLCLPDWVTAAWKKHFFNGLFDLAGKNGVALIGGDLAHSERFTADIVVLGECPRGRSLRRSAAKTGDRIYVSGLLGGSALGLERLQAGRSRFSDPAVRRHLLPTPRLALGQYLSRQPGVHAALDLSDGLSIDLFRLTKESGVGAEIRAADLPVFPGATLDQALHGGEDYELLFTCDARPRLPQSMGGVRLTPIGVITRGKRLVLVGADGRRRTLPVKGFEHDL
jgi:thiamine-monophosphate kinase